MENLNEALTVIRELNIIHTDLEKRIKEKVINLLEAINKANPEECWMYVGHQVGIPHTSTDFLDEDESGVPKTKVFDYITARNGKIVLQYSDGTTSDDCTVDDWGYLLDDLMWEISDNYNHDFTSKE